MNDPMKYLITGAAIAIVCGAAGTMGGVWLMKEMGNSQSPATNPKLMISGKPSPISTQPSIGGQSVFSGQRMPQNPVITIPPRPANGSNIAFRPAPPTGKMLLNYNQFQKLQELPEVKKAREQFMEAQKKYSETMKKAVESGQGAVANVSKSAPLTIQVPPVRAGTNGNLKGK